MLLCMLTDPKKPQFRERAVAEILKIRVALREKERLELEAKSAKRKPGRPPKKVLVRTRNKVDKINLDAKTYPDLIDFSALELLEPPLTQRLSDEELQNFLHNWNYLQIPSGIPCHSQSVERMVGVCTPVVGKFKTPEMRLAQIYLRLEFNQTQKASSSQSSHASSSFS